MTTLTGITITAGPSQGVLITGGTGATYPFEVKVNNWTR